MRLPVERDLHLEPLRRERRDLRAWGRNGGRLLCRCHASWPRGQSARGARIGVHGQQVDGRGDLFHARGHVRQREALGEQSLDLLPGPARRRGDELFGVLRCKMWPQQEHAAQVQPALRHGIEDRRELASGGGGPGALAGDVLGHAVNTDAVRVHRRIPLGEVELACIEFAEIGQEIGRGDVVVNNPRREHADDFAIGELGPRPGLHRVIHRGGGCAGARTHSRTRTFGARGRPHVARREALRRHSRSHFA